MDSEHRDTRRQRTGEEGPEAGRTTRSDREGRHRHAESAARLSDQAAGHVERGYDATREAFVHEQRRQGREDEDENVSPG